MNISKYIPVTFNSFKQGLLLYFTLSVCFLPFYYYKIDPDGISYIQVAEQYAQGNFSQAINGYWSPLICWLLVPFSWLGVFMPLAFKLILLFSGAMVLLEIRKLQKVFSVSLSDWMEKGAFLSLSIMLSRNALEYTSPDLLSVWLSLWWLRRMSENHKGLKGSLFSGMLAAFLFFSKSYYFYFVTLFWLARLLLLRRNQLLSKQWKGLMLEALTFLVFASFWIIPLSQKYEKFTISTSGHYNQQVFGPARKGNHPMFTDGFLEPTTATGSSVWDDPSYIQVDPVWSPIGSLGELKYQLLYLSFQNVLDLLSEVNPVLIMSLLAFIIWAISAFRKGEKDYQKELLLAYLLLYPLGYLMIVVEERYIWNLMYLLVFVAFYLADRVSEKFPEIQKSVLAIGLLAMLTVFPLKDHLAYSLNHAFLFRSMHAFSEEKPIDLAGKRIGSFYGPDQWHFSLYFSWYNEATYIGQTFEHWDWEKIISESQSFHLDYFLLWDVSSSGKIPDSLEEVYYEPEIGLKILKFN